jgi:hypothetical protein
MSAENVLQVPPPGALIPERPRRFRRSNVLTPPTCTPPHPNTHIPTHARECKLSTIIENVKTNTLADTSPNPHTSGKIEGDPEKNTYLWDKHLVR